MIPDPTGALTSPAAPGIPSPRTPADDTARSGPMPCVARPHSGLVHRDGPCRCFTGGPAPQHGTVLAPAFDGAA